MPDIRSKKQMYEMLSAGLLGNTIPQYFSIERWEASEDYGRYPLWGIRSGQAGGDPKCRLNVPTAEVAPLFHKWFPDSGGNISCMVDAHAVLRGEIIDTVDAPRPGLNLFYVPPTAPIDTADPWRGSFRNFGRHVAGAGLRLILEQYLWPSDLEELRDLIDRYPEHAIEFTACDRAIGIIPNRNTCIWECRRY